MDDRGIIPLRADFEKLDTLSGEGVADVEFLADVRGGRRLARNLSRAFSIRFFSRSLKGIALTSHLLGDPDRKRHR